MKRPMRVEVFGRRGRGYFRVRSGNGEVLMQCAKPNGYSNKAGARRAARRLVDRMGVGPVEVVNR